MNPDLEVMQMKEKKEAVTSELLQPFPVTFCF